MSILVRFAPTSLTAEQYEQVRSRMMADGPPDGLQAHVCFGSEGNLRVSEVWSSREQFEAIGERLMPAISEAGITMSEPPEILDVHNVVIP